MSHVKGDVMEEWICNSLFVTILQGLFRCYENDDEERQELARKLRRLADHIEAGGPRPTNILLGDPAGYKVP
jgi:hypothetical protein